MLFHRFIVLELIGKSKPVAACNGADFCLLFSDILNLLASPSSTHDFVMELTDKTRADVKVYFSTLS